MLQGPQAEKARKFLYCSDLQLVTAPIQILTLSP